MKFSIVSMFASLTMKNVLSCNVSLIYNLQDSLNHFIILILLDSK